MKDKIFLEECLEQGLQMAGWYYAIDGSGLRNKIRRTFATRGKYLIYSVLHKIKLQVLFPVKLFWGKRIILPLNDVDAKFLYYFGLLGKAEEPLIRFLLKQVKPGDVFYDIGANYGFYTHLASELIESGECHTFEPNKKTYNFLSRNFDTAQQDKIYLQNLALTNTEGEIVFYDATEKGASGISTTSAQMASLRSGDYIESVAQSITLDTYVKNHRAPTIMKIDIEGAEIDMLRGAESFLRDNAPIITLEVIKGERGELLSSKAAQFLLSLGYHAYLIQQDGSLISTETVVVTDFDPSFINFVFKKDLLD